MNPRLRRIKSLAAALAPLLALALFWLVFCVAQDDRDDLLEKVAGMTVLCGLGPAGSFLILPARWSFEADIAAFFVIWIGYVLVHCFTGAGLSPWGVHAGLSTAWCAIGLFAMPVGLT